MKYLLLFLLSTTAIAKPLVVAVIDTGLSPQYANYMCGSSDLTGTGIQDIEGHGTNVSGLIWENAGKPTPDQLCFFIIKYYDRSKPGYIQQHNSNTAFHIAIKQKVNFINFSSYGENFDLLEKILIQTAIKKGIKVAVPSGNKRVDFSKKCSIFPACYLIPGLTVVARNDLAAYVSGEGFGFGGPVNAEENGFMRVGWGITMSGTSQATAVRMGKMIRKRLGL